MRYSTYSNVFDCLFACQHTLLNTLTWRICRFGLGMTVVHISSRVLKTRMTDGVAGFGFYPPLNREDFTSFHIQIIGSAVSFETVDRYANDEEFVHKRKTPPILSVVSQFRPIHTPLFHFAQIQVAVRLCCHWLQHF